MSAAASAAGWLFASGTLDKRREHRAMTQEAERAVEGLRREREAKPAPKIVYKRRRTW